MARQAKPPTQEIVDLVTKMYKDNVPMDEIVKQSGLSTSTIYKHIKVRRGHVKPKREKPKPVPLKEFNLSALDTLMKKGESFRVIRITDKHIIVKNVFEDVWRQAKPIKISIEKYMSGASGYRKVNFSPCVVVKSAT